MQKKIVIIMLLCTMMVLPTVSSYAQPPTPLSGGSILVCPMASFRGWVVKEPGIDIHDWMFTNKIDFSAYSMPDGSIFRTYNTLMALSGFQHISWDGRILWDFSINGTTSNESFSHDICILPNGNVLAIIQEVKSRDDAIANGRDPTTFSTYLMSQKIMEIKQNGTNSGDVVWEWSVWDHLIQDYDATKENYGVVSDHPELININYDGGLPGRDWIHLNSIDYNTKFDQIMVASKILSEIWVIKHNSSGGLLYRWGNPQAYDRGTSDDQMLFGPHDAEWIKPNYPGYGHITIFNNGIGRGWSSVDEFAPPVNSTGCYYLAGGEAYGPTSIVWTWTDTPVTRFYQDHLCGASRLPNGNTLICATWQQDIFVVNHNKDVVWSYNPHAFVYKVDFIPPQHKGV